jgi:hypothetical protein
MAATAQTVTPELAQSLVESLEAMLEAEWEAGQPGALAEQTNALENVLTTYQWSLFPGTVKVAVATA